MSENKGASPSPKPKAGELVHCFLKNQWFMVLGEGSVYGFLVFSLETKRSFILIREDLTRSKRLAIKEKTNMYWLIG